jgi:hypothetical protein
VLEVFKKMPDCLIPSLDQKYGTHYATPEELKAAAACTPSNSAAVQGHGWPGESAPVSPAELAATKQITPSPQKGQQKKPGHFC